MVTGHVFIATSLDGFIARNDGDIQWLTSRGDPSEDHGYEKFMEGIDAIVMGRGTYEKVLSFEVWPYSKPVLVLSKTLESSKVPESLKGRVQFSSLSPQELMSFAEQNFWRRIYVDGGKVIQSFLREGLIEDMIITQIPVLLGGGRPLFASHEKEINLKHLDTRSFASGFVQSHYRVLK